MHMVHIRTFPIEINYFISPVILNVNSLFALPTSASVAATVYTLDPEGTVNN